MRVFGQKTYNGVAILVARAGRDVVTNIVGFDDEQARVIAGTRGRHRASVNGYFVNGQAPGSDKFAYKMRWLSALRDWLRDELAAHPQLVLLGDFNIAPEDRDVLRPGRPGPARSTTRREEREHFAGAARRWAWSTLPAVRAAAEELQLVGLPHARRSARTAGCASTTSWSARR